jgi:hypothetical protein
MAAGLGFKEFTTGDVLTAADANGYLASQVVMVFADAAARTSAIASPQEGMISYLKDTNATEYYSGSAWVAVGGGSSGGMTSIASGSLSTGTLTLNTISGSYKNLQLVVRDWYPSVDAALNLRLNNASAGNSYSATGSYWNGASTVNFGSLGTSAPLTSQSCDGANYRNAIVIDIPDYTNTTANKLINVVSGYVEPAAVQYYVERSTTMWNDTTPAAVTRIDLILSTGTFSGGTYILYGVN